MGKKAFEMKEISAGQIRIQKMKGEDLEEVMAIEKASFLSPWTRNMFLKELKEGGLSRFLVAMIAKKVVGYGGFSAVLDKVHIDNLVVHSHFRRRKIGEKLLSALLVLAKSEGMRKVSLEVRTGNTPAQNLYNKFGFQAIGCHQRYYQDTWEDALLMSLDLSCCSVSVSEVCQDTTCFV